MQFSQVQRKRVSANNPVADSLDENKKGLALKPPTDFTNNTNVNNVVQNKLQDRVNISHQVTKATQLQTLADSFSGKTVQKQGAEEEELMQGKFKTVQKQGAEEEDLMQGKFKTIQKQEAEEEELQMKKASIQKKAGSEPGRSENNTGLPDNISAGIENLSGYSMDDVKVHYNSDKPTQLQAHAFTQGTDIHVAPGQEQHLPHEAWHVVQQKQGRVKPTIQAKGVSINDDASLEMEADIMGSKISGGIDKSVQMKAISSGKNSDVIQSFSFFGLFGGNKGKDKGKDKEEEYKPKLDTKDFPKKAENLHKSMVGAYNMTKKAKGNISKTNKKYKQWMDSGAVDTGETDTRVEHVKEGFNKVEKCLKEDEITFKKYALNDGEEDETYAYVDTSNDDKDIFLGGSFWGAKIKGGDSKAGTIVHELTHKLHATKDHVYGQKGAKNLAKKDPAKGTTNADNYEYFAEKS
ncbi:MAG: DUF4157 domain-containing protein [Saprospiraceae bacterium]|nr:DUF4157 domain-containing protein [Saprospiraceae bacterium]